MQKEQINDIISQVTNINTLISQCQKEMDVFYELLEQHNIDPFMIEEQSIDLRSRAYNFESGNLYDIDAIHKYLSDLELEDDYNVDRE